MWDFKWKDDSFFLVVHLPSASASELPRAWQKSLEAFCRGRNSTKSRRKYCSSGGRRHDTIIGSSSTDLTLAPDARSSVGATCFELSNPFVSTSVSRLFYICDTVSESMCVHSSTVDRRAANDHYVYWRCSSLPLSQISFFDVEIYLLPKYISQTPSYLRAISTFSDGTKVRR